LAARADAIVTAGLRPEFFAERGIVSLSRTLVVTALAVLVLAGFGLRVTGLSSEGLGEDELNKLRAVEDYRQNGLTAANGEHPFLMKALQTGSVFLAEQWNKARPDWQIAPETALRFPGTIFGALTVILIYLFATELFGAEIGLIAAALWAFDPNAIGFNRIAKEDTFLLFFFLLANTFWLWGQRAAESEPQRKPERYYWATAAAFGAMLASKYLPQLLAITLAYYWLFQALPETRWRLGKRRMLKVVGIMAIVFLALNPTILLPDTWKQMGMFAAQKLVGHDGYEFMGTLYSHKATDWLNGIPWYFYATFILVKLPVLSLIGFVVGLPLLFRRRLGDGRYFILMWLFLWTMTFMFAGGKFTRYLTTVFPAVLITAAIGIQMLGRVSTGLLSRFITTERIRFLVPAIISIAVVLGSANAASAVAPHFRLYLNAFGGGAEKIGYYFPHDEFYDAGMKDALEVVVKEAGPNARVASETPTVAQYYAKRANRFDLSFISLSDPEELKNLTEGDLIITARGRRYFGNDALMSAMPQLDKPIATIDVGKTPAVEIYRLRHNSLSLVLEIVDRLPRLDQDVNIRRAPSTP